MENINKKKKFNIANINFMQYFNFKKNDVNKNILLATSFIKYCNNKLVLK